MRAALVLTLSLLCSSVPVLAQTPPAPHPYLAAAVQALADGEAELGLQLLERAEPHTDDPRLTYYRAFALEKLGRCDEARTSYVAAQSSGLPEFERAAKAALEGLQTRCTPLRTRPQAPAVREVRRAAPAAVSLGLIVSTIGGMGLLAVPAKHAFDQQVASTSEEYFARAYACKVSGGEIDAGCDRAAIEADEQWDVYERRNATARTSTIALAVGGTTLLGVGILAIALGSRRVAVSAAPGPGGAVVIVRAGF